MTTIASPVYRCPLPAPAIEPSVATAALRHAAADPGAVAVVDGATGETPDARRAGRPVGRPRRRPARRRRAPGRPGRRDDAQPRLVAGRRSGRLARRRRHRPRQPAVDRRRVGARARARRTPGWRSPSPRSRERCAVGSARAGLHDVELAVLGGDAAGATPIEALLGSRRGRPLRRARPRPRRPRRRAVLQRHLRAAQGRAPHPRQPRRGAEQGSRRLPRRAAATTSARSSSPRLRSSTRSASRSCSAGR